MRSLPDLLARMRMPLSPSGRVLPLPRHQPLVRIPSRMFMLFGPSARHFPRSPEHPRVQIRVLSLCNPPLRMCTRFGPSTRCFPLLPRHRHRIRALPDLLLAPPTTRPPLPPGQPRLRVPPLPALIPRMRILLGPSTQRLPPHRLRTLALAELVLRMRVHHPGPPTRHLPRSPHQPRARPLPDRLPQI